MLPMAWICAQGAAQEMSPTAQLRGLLPTHSVAVVEIADPRAACTELGAAIGGMPLELRDQLGLSAWAGLAAVSFATGGDLPAFAAMLARGGAAIAITPVAAGFGAVAVLRRGDGEAAARWFDRYAQQLPRARVGDLLVIGSHAELVANVEAAATTSAPATRWATADFGPPAAVRGRIDLAALRRRFFGASRPFAALDGGARFLLLPLLHALQEAEDLQLALTGGARLALRVATATTARRGDHGFLFASAAATDAAATTAATHAAIALPADGLALLRLDRSLRALLAEPERFLSPAEVVAVQGFLSIADALDGPHSSFVDDLLGALVEPIALHVLPLAPPIDEPSPPLQLPGIALIAKVREPKVEALLGRMAQVFVVIANVERQQRGQAPFRLRSDTTSTGRGFVAEPSPWRGPGAPPIEQALSPTLWFENGHVVLASTRTAASMMIAASRAGSAEPDRGDGLRLCGPGLAQALAASRDVLTLARMLDEGESRAAAERFFDRLTAILRAVRELSLRIACTDTATTLELALERAR
jgi:hypothetical protein